MSALRRIVPIALIATASCVSSEEPLAPSVFATPAATLRGAAAGTGGLAGFSFLPPIAQSGDGDVQFDATLLESLTVEICAWVNAVCVTPPVERITHESALPGRLRLDTDAGEYRSLWKVPAEVSGGAALYRIRVLGGGQELGHAIVGVGQADDRSENVSRWVREGSTLPIAFRIEQGLAAPAGPEGSRLELQSGNVVLDIPTGALGKETLITAAPAVDLPTGGPPIVPGTAWNLGPDGLTFETPITLTIRFDPANLPPGTAVSELRIHKLVEGTYVQQDAGTVDPLQGTASARIDGFSTYVLLERQFDGSLEDLQPPSVQSITVLDASSGLFQSSTSLVLSDQPDELITRISLSDDISGVFSVEVTYLSPSQEQLRRACYPTSLENPPTNGNDTNGEWDCPSTWPRYSEAGEWTTAIVHLRDKAGNMKSYFAGPVGLCDLSQGTPECLDDAPDVQVVSDPTDTSQPDVSSFAVSLDVLPRAFGDKVSVDAAEARWIVFGFAATDDLSGVGRGPDPDIFWGVIVRGPSGQTLYAGCPNEPVTGDALDGFWECRLLLPAAVEAGTWQAFQLVVIDRVGNGGRQFRSVYKSTAPGQLCTDAGACVPAPSIEVISIGDAHAPEITSLDLATTDNVVTVALAVTDDISGANFIRVTYRSQVSTQVQECFPYLNSGTPTAGVWTCILTFSEFAARGDWYPEITLFDTAGNFRFYRRGASDGEMCQDDPAGPVCADVGETDIVVQDVGD